MNVHRNNGIEGIVWNHNSYGHKKFALQVPILGQASGIYVLQVDHISHVIRPMESTIMCLDLVNNKDVDWDDSCCFFSLETKAYMPTPGAQEAIDRLPWIRDNVEYVRRG